jgi:hypothetical protein
MKRRRFPRHFFSGVLCVLTAFSITVHAFAFEIPIEQREQVIDGRQTLTKVYEVSADVNPKSLIEEDFPQHGYLYTMTSITKEVSIATDTKTVTQEHSITSNVSKEEAAREAALMEMPAYLEYDQDGYVGKLYPVPSTLSGEEAGRKNGSGQKTITKTYTFNHNDDGLVPKQVDGHNLVSLSWKEGTYNEDSALSGVYTATATYSKSYSYSTVTGWIHTMEYVGEVEYERAEKIRYTIIYTGTLIQEDKVGLFERLFGSNPSEKTESPNVGGEERSGSAEIGRVVIGGICVLFAIGAMGAILYLSIRMLKSRQVVIYARDEISGAYSQIKRMGFNSKKCAVAFNPALAPQSRHFRISFNPILSEELKGKIVTVQAGTHVSKSQIGDAGGMDYIIDLNLE